MGNKVIFKILLIMTIIYSSLSCTCVFPKNIIEAFNTSNAVFQAQVIDTSFTSNNTQIMVLLRVFKSWKGVLNAFTIVRTNLNSAACGFDFTIGKVYVIFAKVISGKLNVSLCSFTQLNNVPVVQVLDSFLPKGKMK
jgi:hypothetical protein